MIVKKDAQLGFSHEAQRRSQKKLKLRSRLSVAGNSVFNEDLVSVALPIEQNIIENAVLVVSLLLAYDRSKLG